MIKKNKIFLFSISLLLLVIIGSSVVSATDITSSNITTKDNSLNTNLGDNSKIVSDSIQTDSVKDSKINELKNIKTENIKTTINKDILSKGTSFNSTNNLKTVQSTHQVTPSTYSTYFNNDSKINHDTVNSGDVLNFNGTFKNVGFTIDIPINITSISGETTILNGSINLIAGSSGTNISNIEINNYNYVDDAIVLNNTNDNLIKNISLYQENTKFTSHGIHIIESNNNQIINSMIDVKGLSTDIEYDPVTWEASVINTTAIYIDPESTNNLIQNNIINAIYNNIIGSYDSIDGICIDGTNNTFSNNILNVIGHTYTYGIHINYGGNNTLSENSISVSSANNQAIGLNIGSDENTINDNNITINGVKSSYGMIISTMGIGDSKLNTIKGNEINSTSTNAYGIELYQSDLNSIILNRLIIEGDFALGIVGYESNNNTLRINEIITSGTGNGAKTSDAIDPDNIGIGFYANSSYNSISYNLIETFNSGNTTTRSIYLSKSNINSIIGNDITISGPECSNVYDENNNICPSNTTAILLNLSNNITVNRNIINTHSNKKYGNESSIESISITGNDNTISENNITTTGLNNTGGITIYNNATNNIISENIINSYSNIEANGIEINSANNNLLYFNKLFIYGYGGSGIAVINSTSPEKSIGTVILGNKIYVDSIIGVGIIIANVENTEINNNMFSIMSSSYISENYESGIIGINSYNTTIYENIISIIMYNNENIFNQYTYDVAIGFYDNSSLNNVSVNSIIINNVGNGTVRGIIFSDSYNNTAISNVLTVNGPECEIKYDEEFNPNPVNTIGILLDSADNNLLYENILNIASNNACSTYSTIESICIDGTENKIINNYVSTTGFNYVYGITLNKESDNNILFNNIIDSTSFNVAEGIQIIESKNNIINLNSILSTGNIGYGIYISDNGKSTASNNTLNYNTITVDSQIGYGIDLFGADNTQIKDNTLSIGSKFMPAEFGLGIIGSKIYNTSISNNTIKILSNSTKEISSYDIIDNVGIGLYSDSTNNNITQNDISVNNMGIITTHGIVISNSDKNTFKNNDILVIGPECNIVYDEEFNPNPANTTTVLINGNNNLLLNNYITTEGGLYYWLDTYGTIESIFIDGDNNKIVNNDIYTDGGKYSYTIDVKKGTGNEILANYITSRGILYSNGIQIFINGVKTDNQILIANNSIGILSVGYGYGIYVNGKGGNTTVNILDNEIKLNSKIARGIELLNINGNVNNNIITTTVSYEKLDYTMGIIGYEITNTIINSNNITVNGKSTENLTDDYDVVKVTNIGVILVKSNNNSITNNNVFTKVDYTITIDGTGNNITNNYLLAYKLKGDNSVNATTGNIVKNNLPSNNKTATIVSADNIVACAGKNVTFRAIVTDEYGNMIDSGKVVFKLNGNTIGYGYVSNGIVTFNYVIPSHYSMKNYIITVKYGGNDKYESSSDESILTLGKQETSIVTKDIVSQAGKTVTFTAAVSDLVKDVIDSGKVVFKLNGNTIGTANVINGKASINYTIPSNYSAKNYTITVKYSGSKLLEPSTNNATLSLTKITNIETNVVSFDNNLVNDNQTSVGLI
ncbi:MAG: Ig-like domain-containing protein [Methanobacteriaceae archaeon]|nr:Ig-like domain-containing protein [Methanobacteriaceae archaeon]